MSRLMISIHITKTAGTSFGSFLKEAYGPKMIFVYPCAKCQSNVFGFDLGKVLKSHQAPCETHQTNFREIALFVRENSIECIHGHIYPDTILSFFPWAQYAVWFRDPIERVVSHFEFLKRNTGVITDWSREAIEKNSLPQFAKISCNHQALWLRRLPLRAFSFIGIVECMNEDLLRFSRKFNIPTSKIPTENVNPGKGIGKYSLDNEMRDVIESVNRADIRLYNEALALRGKENELLSAACRFGVVAMRKGKGLIKLFLHKANN